MKKTALIVGAISIIPRHVVGKGFLPPSDQVNLGIIGLGKQGNHLASLFIKHTEAKIIASGDVWDTKRSHFKSYLENLNSGVRRSINYSVCRHFSITERCLRFKK